MTSAAAIFGDCVFSLLIFFPDEKGPRHIERLERASDTAPRVRSLLDAHPGCARIDVMMDDRRLYAVDCAGNQVG